MDECVCEDALRKQRRGWDSLELKLWGIVSHLIYELRPKTQVRYKNSIHSKPLSSSPRHSINTLDSRSKQSRDYEFMFSKCLQSFPNDRWHILKYETLASLQLRAVLLQ